LQFSGQTAIQNPIDAEQQYVAKKAAQSASEKRLQDAKKAVWYCRIRVWVVRTGLPAWAAGLLGGSAAALVLAWTQILLFGAELGMVCIGILAAYAACGGGFFWIFRLLNGEDDDNRVQYCTEQLRQAEDRCRYTTAILRERIANADKAKQLWRSIIQAVLADEDHRRIDQLQRSAEKARVNEENRMEQLRRAAEQARINEENNRRIATVRLLNIDSGQLSGDEFEQYVAEIFRHLGFIVEVTGKTGDLGMDVLACKGQLRLAIQAKRYTGPVGNDAVSAVFTAKTHYRCDHCLVVSTSRFTRSAKKLAQSTGCRLIGADEIGVLIRGEIMF
jgi:hypothetical protein